MGTSSSNVVNDEGNQCENRKKWIEIFFFIISFKSLKRKQAIRKNCSCALQTKRYYLLPFTFFVAVILCVYGSSFCTDYEIHFIVSYSFLCFTFLSIDSLYFLHTHRSQFGCDVDNLYQLVRCCQRWRLSNISMCKFSFALFSFNAFQLFSWRWKNKQSVLVLGCVVYTDWQSTKINLFDTCMFQVFRSKTAWIPTDTIPFWTVFPSHMYKLMGLFIEEKNWKNALLSEWIIERNQWKNHVWVPCWKHQKNRWNQHLFSFLLHLKSIIGFFFGYTNQNVI